MVLPQHNDCRGHAPPHSTLIGYRRDSAAKVRGSIFALRVLRHTAHDLFTSLILKTTKREKKISNFIHRQQLLKKRTKGQRKRKKGKLIGPLELDF